MKPLVVIGIAIIIACQLYMGRLQNQWWGQLLCGLSAVGVLHVVMGNKI